MGIFPLGRVKRSQIGGPLFTPCTSGHWVLALGEAVLCHHHLSPARTKLRAKEDTGCGQDRDMSKRQGP